MSGHGHVLAGEADEAVRGLPDVARDESEIEEEPAAWSAPVGIVIGRKSLTPCRTSG